MSKREFQRRKKVFVQGMNDLKQTGYIFTGVALALTILAKVIFSSHPHQWYEITGKLDILLLGFALVLSLVNMYLKITVLFIQTYIRRGNIAWTIFTILFPFVSIFYSIFSKYSALYITPFICIILIHAYMHIKSR